uniref:Uncharacterized protein n=1 Tax=Knipowitschia caucasica TaxID=637954 RepID=A0AAV2MBY0_KNICA
MPTWMDMSSVKADDPPTSDPPPAVTRAQVVSPQEDGCSLSVSIALIFQGGLLGKVGLSVLPKDTTTAVISGSLWRRCRGGN